MGFHWMQWNKLTLLVVVFMSAHGLARGSQWTNRTEMARDGGQFSAAAVELAPIGCVDMSTCLLGGSVCNELGFQGRPQSHSPFGWSLLAPRTAHKPLFPLSVRDIIGLTLAALGLALSASGGLGGGGILVPLYLIVLRFDTYSAVALSNVTIVGGTLTNLAVNVGRRHPLREGPLIDWDLILVMEPATILGAILGTYVNHILPPWITTLSLALLLSYITNNLLKKARVISAKDRERSQAIRAAEAELDSGGGDVYTSISTTHLADVEEGGQNGEAGSTDDLAGDEDDISRPLLDGEATPEPEAAAPRRLRKRDRVRRLANNALEHYQPEVPWVKMLTLFALLGCVVTSDLLKTKFHCPSVGYWAVVLALLPITIVVMLIARTYLVRKTKRRADRNHQYVEGDVVWDAKTTLLFPALCSGAGLAAGIFGVGGGIIKGPIMLEMGVLPEVTAATSATMILFTSVSASVVFISLGAVPPDYGVALALLGLLFTAVGQGLVLILQARSGSRSLIVWIMTAAMGISTVFLLGQGIETTVAAFKEHTEWDFGGVCGHGGSS